MCICVGGMLVSTGTKETRGTEDCELPSVGAENCTQVLNEKQALSK